ncbi:MAG TPA: hypothetical protein HPP83_03280 [Candidatus Hydrogenedentes bacterium]|nr:hypothetical protein [Candidatus Hydrogenedentota bacterium]
MPTNLERSAELLALNGILLGSKAEARIAQHAKLVREWNAFASLVSENDLTVIEDTHVVDSLSLAPWVIGAGGRGAALLDIGSGGGFPALPLKIALPELRVTLVERSERKVGFLLSAAGAMGLDGVTVVHGNFPEGVSGLSPDAVTARAVEKPDKVGKAILAFLPGGSTFLCQSGAALKNLPPMFHVERIHDAWSRAGLRRGELFVVQRLDPDRPIEPRGT